MERRVKNDLLEIPKCAKIVAFDMLVQLFRKDNTYEEFGCDVHDLLSELAKIDYKKN